MEILDKNPSLKFIAENYDVCNYEELRRGLEWLSTKAYCRGGNCRAGDGWADCPVRKCCVAKGIDFCFQCEEFPCKLLSEHELFGELFGEKYVRRLREIKEEGLESWIKRNYG